MAGKRVDLVFFVWSKALTKTSSHSWRRVTFSGICWWYNDMIVWWLYDSHLRRDYNFICLRHSSSSSADSQVQPGISIPSTWSPMLAFWTKSETEIGLWNYFICYYPLLNLIISCYVVFLASHCWVFEYLGLPLSLWLSPSLSLTRREQCNCHSTDLLLHQLTPIYLHRLTPVSRPCPFTYMSIHQGLKSHLSLPNENLKRGDEAMRWSAQMRLKGGGSFYSIKELEVIFSLLL